MMYIIALIYILKNIDRHAEAVDQMNLPLDTFAL